MSDSDSPEKSEGEIKIELPFTSDDQPSDPKAQRYKGLASILVAAAAFITAMAAIFKPQDTTSTRNSYNELRTAVEQNTKENQQNHDDIVALHNYLDGYFKGEGTPISLPPLSPTAVTSSSSTATAFLVPLDRTKLHGSDGGLVPFTVVAPPLPSVHTASSSRKLPEFDTLMDKK